MINQTYKVFYSIIEFSHFKMLYKLRQETDFKYIYNPISKTLEEFKFKNSSNNFNKNGFNGTTRLIFVSKDMPFLSLRTK
jgi:hypothetical protein